MKRTSSAEEDAVLQPVGCERREKPCSTETIAVHTRNFYAPLRTLDCGHGNYTKF
jgi:hypothetical protein